MKKKYLMVKKFYNKIKKWYEKYERLLLPGTLVFGVIVDSVTFASIQISTTFLILALHILFAGGVIAYFNAYDAGLVNKNNRALATLRLASPLAIQFSFGALLSASFIFYFFSGSVYASWPLILALVFLMAANDLFRKYYLRPEVQVAVYYFLLLSTSAIILPYALKKLGPEIFLLSAATSLLLILGYVGAISRIVKSFAIGRFLKPILFIFLVMNTFYFSNIIPPVPLSMREAVVGHVILRSGDAYRIFVEKENFWEQILPGRTVHKKAGGAVAVYTAIFAPSKLSAQIFHNWQHKEEGEWVTKSRLAFTLTGGRKEGFRGYSVKTAVPSGEWRVLVETARGQVIGRVRFRVEEVAELPEIAEERR